MQMPFIDLFDDPDDVGKVVVAVQRAIVEHFTEGDWTQIAYETGTQDYILRHKRLLRSLNWRDDDYGTCVFEVLRRFSGEKVSAFEALVIHPKIQPEIERDCSDILQRIGINTGHVAQVSTEALSAPDVVARALSDADTLLKTSGPVSCVDRLHTALHGYFRSLCERALLQPPEGASLPALFKLLRTQHSALQNLGSQDQDVSRVLGGFASVVDALNTIRNHASVAHPNDDLLGEEEALLMVNAVRTLFHYVHAKVSK
jgi:hypothetical protein